jgi:glycosyltransferase involved in cell wall biosynthesis
MAQQNVGLETTRESIPGQAGRRVAFLLPSLVGGGAERTVVKMLREMSAAGIELDLVVASAHGLYLDQIPRTVRLIDLHARRVSEAVIPLSRYLRRERPSVIISNMAHLNTIVCLAKVLTRGRTAVICVEHNHVGAEQNGRESWVQRLAWWLYPSADAVVAVSQGVKESVEASLKPMRGKVKVIFPPVVDEELLAEAEAPVEHPWLRQEIPVFVAAGRLSPQKDFATLLDAFHQMRRHRQAHLLILGEGPCRGALEAQVSALKLSEDVAMPGFAANPYAYMRHASAFVLSSRHEGMPAVLIEAMACGCPVISTDCPSGPSEILEGGRYGALVPVGDAASLASAMIQTLDAPIPAERLRRKAMEFTTARATNAFLDLAEHLTNAILNVPAR